MMLSGAAGAATLGEAEVRSYLGAPLYLRIPVSAAAGEMVDAACFAVIGERNLATTGADYQLTLVETRAGRFLQIRGNGNANEPILRLNVRSGCEDDAKVIREYAVLLDPPPSITAPAGAASAAGTTSGSTPSTVASTAAPTIPGAAPPAPNPAIKPSEGRWTAYDNDTLASIATGIYPKLPAMQAQYIDSLKRLNPAVSMLDDNAPLPAGSQLVLPDLRALSSLAAKSNNAKPAAASTAAQAKPAPAKAKPASAEKPAQASPAPVKTIEPKPAPAKAPATAATPPAPIEKPAAEKSPKAQKPAVATAVVTKPATPAPIEKPAKAPAPAPASAPPAPAAAPASKPVAGKPRDDGFHLRLSGAEMDLSRAKGVTEKQRAQLREKQLLLDADDQVSAMLALKNTVKQLEQRLNEMQLKMSASTQVPAKAAPTAPAPTPAPAPAPQAAAQPSPASKPATPPAAVSVTPEAAAAMKGATVTTEKSVAATEPSPPSPPPARQPAIKPVLETEKSVARPSGPPSGDDALALDSPWVLGGGAAGFLLLLTGWWFWRGKRSKVYTGPIPHHAMPVAEPTPEAPISDQLPAVTDRHDSEHEAPTGDVAPYSPRLARQMANLSAAPTSATASAPSPVSVPSSVPEPMGEEAAASIDEIFELDQMPAMPAMPAAPSSGAPASATASAAPATDPSLTVDFFAGPDLDMEPSSGEAAYAKTVKFERSPLLDMAPPAAAGTASSSKFDVDTPATFEVDAGAATAVDFLVDLDEKPPEDRVRRLQYMYERYPELATGTVAIDDADTVINAARLYYEEAGEANAQGKAEELLTFAVEERPQEIRYWLAQFEIYRLEQNVSEFSTLAAKFQMLYGHLEQWPKVRHIGHELDPDNPLFAAAERPALAGEPFDPIAENWLNAPTDFASDALAADLRSALFQQHQVGSEDFAAITSRLAS